MTERTTLSDAPKYTRSLSGRGLFKAKGDEAPRVDRTGGKFGHGIIRGVSLNTKGEALGHDLWLDDEFIDSVVSASSTKRAGLKARFTHPGLSSDGMGSQLGRLFDIQRIGDQAVGDLHFTKASHNTPDGDLAEFVMNLADETPEDFGLSIVFKRDRDAEKAHREGHAEEFSETDPDTGRNRKGRRFKSPDPLNVRNLAHARLAELMAGDVVDEPAANPGGLFTRKKNPVAVEADELMAFALGLCDTAPASTSFSVHPERVKRFAERFLDSRGLSIVKKGTPMADANTKEAGKPAEQDGRASFNADLKKYTERFGATLAVEYLGAGLSWEQSLEKFCAHQGEQLKAAESKGKEAAEQLAALNIGEQQPLEAGKDGKGSEPKKSLASVIRFK